MLIGLGLFLTVRPVFGQTDSSRLVYVVDSVLVESDPGSDDDLSPADIAEMVVVKNKDSLQRLGYGRFNGVAFIFTKAYRARPDSIKKNPSLKQMVQKNGVWYFHEAPYSGRVIDYYLNGKVQTEGQLLNGKGNGWVIHYYHNGQKELARPYKDGVIDGTDREFYPDGTLKQEGVFVAGREEGVWKRYFPNGQTDLYSNYLHGELVDSSVRYYSTGMIKERVMIKNGKVISDPVKTKVHQLMNKSAQSDKEEDRAGAIRYATKAIALDSTFADAYFSRGTLKLNDFKFDEAIADLDKALTIEPYMKNALSNRAFARIRKYQFAGGRVLSKNDDVTVMASKGKVDIPAADKEKICSDLQKAISLGDNRKMIMDALHDYCQ
ncbi:hypothetical protein [Puia sp.]|uniref:hypothetical protein n=1 Tax=Puia sp. TaxID=2045100 RepID=UPI002F41CAA2